MSYFSILLFAIIQGLAELLPVSSSAHVILAQHLMGYDPSAPEMTFLLVMLHTGTMFAVLIYFWPRWKQVLSSRKESKTYLWNLLIATAATGVLGLFLKTMIEKLILEKWLGHNRGEIEHIFKMLPLISAALFAGGLLMTYAGLKKIRITNQPINRRDSIWIGLVQGLVLPFRGLSRSGSTISVGLLLGKNRMVAEEFSFALAVVLTPPLIWRELKRFLEATGGGVESSSLLAPGLVGMIFSFISGWFALKWLSNWLEQGRWHYFGIYCLIFSAVVFSVSFF